MQAPPLPTAPAPSPRAGARLWAVSLGLSLLVAIAGYAITGRPDAAFGVPEGSAMAQSEAPSAEQIQAMVERLAQRLQDRPEDAPGWAMLARSYMALGRLDEAAAASARVLQLKPNDAQAMVDHADVLAMKNGRTLQGEPLQLIERALALEPDNLKALALAGAAAFDQGRMKEAARLWDRVAALGPAGSPLVQQAREGAEAARRQAEPGASAGAPTGAGAGSTLGAAPGSNSGGMSSTQASAGAARISGVIRVAPALAGRIAPEDTVFVFARSADAPAGGPRMPLAALKARGRDLPLSFTLDERHAMGAGGLSSARQVVVSVRVSRTGQPAPQPGDLEGQSAPVNVGQQDLRLEISRVVP